MKILFLSKKRSLYGSYNTYSTASTGLFNSAKFVADALRNYNIETKVLEVVDGNDIDREVTNYNPDFVIIEALWVTPAKIFELLTLSRHQNRKWIIRLHSKLSFIAMEGNAMKWIYQYSILSSAFNNLFVSANVEEFNEDINSIFNSKVVYLPNIYNLKYQNYLEVNKDPRVIEIGCFGAIRPLKNHLTQAVASINFANYLGKKLKFHINGTRHEQGGNQVYKNLKNLFESTPHELIEHDWLTHDEFLELVNTIDIGTQVSFTETFNIVAADFVEVGTPIIVSNEIDWIHPVFQVNKLTSTTAIEKKLKQIYYLPKDFLNSLAKQSLKLYNYKATKIWLDFITINS